MAGLDKEVGVGEYPFTSACSAGLAHYVLRVLPYDYCSALSTCRETREAKLGSFSLPTSPGYGSYECFSAEKMPHYTAQHCNHHFFLVQYVFTRFMQFSSAEDHICGLNSYGCYRERTEKSACLPYKRAKLD